MEELTGFPVGTIPPLGHRKRLKTLVDAELLKYSTIVGGAGCRWVVFLQGLAWAGAGLKTILVAFSKTFLFGI